MGRCSGLTWMDETLEKWLSDPDLVVPDNNMSFSVPKAEERRDLIAYLSTKPLSARVTSRIVDVRVTLYFCAGAKQVTPNGAGNNQPKFRLRSKGASSPAPRESHKEP
jgi:hypothetical protein